MATPAQPVTSKTTLPSLDDLKPSIDVSGDSGTIQAIVTNATFPDSPANITVGQLKAQSSAGGQFNLPGVNNVPVGFSVSASVNAALAAYQNPSTLVSDLGFIDTSGNQLKVAFPTDGKSRFLAVCWGFDITFGVSGSSDGLFAFITSVDPAMHVRDAFVALLKAWCTPAAVADGSRPFPPGSWIITEVTGQLNASLGFDAGYDFNWVKQVSLNDLEGDIGLRISLGLQATLSAQLASRFYLVLNRDTTTSGVRLRLFRGKTKGWGF